MSDILATLGLDGAKFTDGLKKAAQSAGEFVDRVDSVNDKLNKLDGAIEVFGKIKGQFDDLTAAATQINDALAGIGAEGFAGKGISDLDTLNEQLSTLKSRLADVKSAEKTLQGTLLGGTAESLKALGFEGLAKQVKSVSGEDVAEALIGDIETEAEALEEKVFEARKKAIDDAIAYETASEEERFEIEKQRVAELQAQKDKLSKEGLLRLYELEQRLAAKTRAGGGDVVTVEGTDPFARARRTGEVNVDPSTGKGTYRPFSAEERRARTAAEREQRKQERAFKARENDAIRREREAEISPSQRTAVTREPKESLADRKRKEAEGGQSSTIADKIDTTNTLLRQLTTHD